MLQAHSRGGLTCFFGCNCFGVTVKETSFRGVNFHFNLKDEKSSNDLLWI